MTYDFQFTGPRGAVATGEMTMVCCRIEPDGTFRSIAIPEPIRQALATYAVGLNAGRDRQARRATKSPRAKRPVGFDLRNSCNGSPSSGEPALVDDQDRTDDADRFEERSPQAERERRHQVGSTISHSIVAQHVLAFVRRIDTHHVGQHRNRGEEVNAREDRLAERIERMAVAFQADFFEVERLVARGSTPSR